MQQLPDMYIYIFLSRYNMHSVAHKNLYQVYKLALRYFYFEPDCSLRLNMLAFNFQVLFKKYEVEYTIFEKFDLFTNTN